MVERGGRYQTLDALRGVAAMAVMLMHLGLWTRHEWVFPRAYLAVDFFFALSGFVIAHAYHDKLASLGLGGFLRLRLIRLWPLIGLAVLVGAAYQIGFAHAAPADTFDQLLRAVVLFPSVPGPLFPLNPPTWSLLFEVAINVAWALVALRLDVRSLLAIILAGAVAIFLIGGPLGKYGQSWLGPGIARVLFSYSIGVLCWRLRHTARSGVPAWLLAGVLLVVFALPKLPAAGPGLDLGLDLGLIGVVFPAVLLAGAASASRGQMLRLGGELSYPLYVMHRPLGFVLLALLPHGKLTTLLMVPLLLGLSWLALKLYDEPVRRRLAGRRP